MLEGDERGRWVLCDEVIERHDSAAKGRQDRCVISRSGSTAPFDGARDAEVVGDAVLEQNLHYEFGSLHRERTAVPISPDLQHSEGESLYDTPD